MMNERQHDATNEKKKKEGEGRTRRRRKKKQLLKKLEIRELTCKGRVDEEDKKASFSFQL
jgi:hypothetical protein